MDEKYFIAKIAVETVDNESGKVKVKREEVELGEKVLGVLKKIRSKEAGETNKEIGKFDKKVKQEAKDPHMDAGVGSPPDFAKGENTSSSPMSRAKDLAKKMNKSLHFFSGCDYWAIVE